MSHAGSEPLRHSEHEHGHARRADGYERRRPEATALYQSIAAHWAQFVERMQEQGGLPKFVHEEFEAYLKCGLVEHGCLELCCRSCGHTMLVALDCIPYCTSCARAVATAARSLRACRMQHNRAATRAFAKEVSQSLKRRAKKELGLRSVRDALTGLVAVVQRTDGALRLNVHLHCLGLDGVYVREADGTLVFQELPTPSRAEVANIARRTAQRLHQAFRKQGRTSPWDDETALADSGETDAFSSEQPGLFACYQAAALGIAVSGERAGQPLLRVVAGGASSELTHDNGPTAEQPVAEALGVSVYAKQLVHGHDRAQLERLCRYVLRPPLSQERLALREDGRLTLTLKHVWKDGTRALLLEPQNLLVRLEQRCLRRGSIWFATLGSSPATAESARKCAPRLRLRRAGLPPSP